MPLKHAWCEMHEPIRLLIDFDKSSEKSVPVDDAKSEVRIARNGLAPVVRRISRSGPTDMQLKRILDRYNGHGKGPRLELQSKW